MKKLLFLSILVFNIFFFSSCEDITILDVASTLLSDSSSSEPVDETTLTLKKEFNWRIANESSKILIGNNTKFISYGSNALQFRDVETGELFWTWDDYVNPNRIGFPRARQYYTKDNLFLFFNTNRYHCIDLKTGETKWKKEIADKDRMSDRIMTGIGDYYFQVGAIEVDTCITQDAVFVGDINSADSMQIILAPDFQQEILGYRHKYGGINALKAFQKSNGEILLAMAYSEPTYNTDSTSWMRNYNYFLGLWNFTKKKWIYKDVAVSGGRHLKIIEDRLYYYSYYHLSCFDLESGQLIWENDLRESESTEIIFSKDYVLLYSSSENILELRNARSGALIWTKRDQLIKQMRLTNKYIYLHYSNLKVFDIPTGELLKTIDNPYDDYPKEGFKYFHSYPDIKTFEKANGVDQVIISDDKYMFGMTFNGEKSDG